jgi:hypothetical protein
MQIEVLPQFEKLFGGYESETRSLKERIGDEHACSTDVCCMH